MPWGPVRIDRVISANNGGWRTPCLSASEEIGSINYLYLLTDSWITDLEPEDSDDPIKQMLHVKSDMEMVLYFTLLKLRPAESFSRGFSSCSCASSISTSCSINRTDELTSPAYTGPWVWRASSLARFAAFSPLRIWEKVVWKKLNSARFWQILRVKRKSVPPVYVCSVYSPSVPPVLPNGTYSCWDRDPWDSRSHRQQCIERKRFLDTREKWVQRFQVSATLVVLIFAIKTSKVFSFCDYFFTL